jgi:UDP-N-acetylglucosamine 3-dehydrogenase
VTRGGRSPLRAGVIGVGAMGSNHARVYRQIEGVELAAVADSDRERLRQAGLDDVSGYEDYRRMLAEERLDLVSVAVPTGLHLEAALAAIERGTAVLVEKPIAGSVEEGRRMVEAAREAGVLLMVGHIERFNPAVRELKRRLTAGELGRVYQVHARRIGPFPQRTRDVGVVRDLASHDVDVMRYLVGSEVERVYAETERKISTEHEDTLVGVLRFAGGIVGVLDVNWLAPVKVRELTVLGERGMFVADYVSQELRLYSKETGVSPQLPWAKADAAAGAAAGPPQTITVEKKEPLRAELEVFVEAVASGAASPMDPADALAAVEVAERLVESGETGRVINVVSAL